jgi:hypothetical protein
MTDRFPVCGLRGRVVGPVRGPLARVSIFLLVATRGKLPERRS